MKYLFLILLSPLLLFAADAFISPSYLKNHINDKELVIVDTSDKSYYNKRHILNAVHADIKRFRHQVGPYQLMNRPKEIEKIAQELGINSDSYVVLYGHNTEKGLLKSSYIALALIANGFDNISILDGGFRDWIATNKTLTSTQTRAIKKGNFVAKPNPDILIDKEYVEAHLGETPMIEARPLKYFNGSEQSSGVKRLGHIKGAQSSFWKEKFNADGNLASDVKLKSIFYDKHKLNADQEVITYCTGGLEASMNWYILSQYMHFKDVKIYDASMREWGNLDNTPMQK